MIKDEIYVAVYDKLGHEHYCKGSDNQLRYWGHSEEDIKKIKIESVKSEIDFSSRGIKSYKLLNELSGGKNVI